ncbi:MAG: hypothetical protein AAB390_00695 [Patescibacteria group bacterium]
MNLADSTAEMMKGLPAGKQSLVNQFVDFLDKKTGALDKACAYLAGKISDKDLTKDFGKLAGDIKKIACVEYLIIGLSSGEIKEDEIKEMYGF